MTTDESKLVREEEDQEQEEAPRRRGRVERGPRRPRRSTRDEVMELQRGAAYATIEATAATMDIVARVLRGTVDRAFARDYKEPGDVVRGVGRDARDVLQDVLGEVREVPQRMTDSFYEAAPRGRGEDRGERHRRARERSDEG